MIAADTRRTWLPACLAALLALAPFQPAFAQPADDAPPANAAEEANAENDEAAEDESLLGLVMKSGVTGWAFLAVLAVFSLFAATVAIERAFRTRRSTIVPEGFVAEMKALVQQPDVSISRLRALCSRSEAPVAAVLRAGVLRAGRPLVEVEKAMEDAAAREMSDIRSRIRPLGVIGSIAPLVGLLGTVLGMIVAFRTASQTGLGKGELMAQGIYLALLTTAAGLSIAIPALLLSAYFNTRTEKLFREMDEHLMETFPCLARFEGTTAGEITSPTAPAAGTEPEAVEPRREPALAAAK